MSVKTSALSVVRVKTMSDCKHTNTEYRGEGDWECKDCGEWFDAEEHQDVIITNLETQLAEARAEIQSLTDDVEILQANTFREQ